MAADPPPGGRLFRKYVLLFVALVSTALLSSGLLQAYFAYQESAASVGQIQRGKAATAAAKIRQFIDETEREIDDITPPPWLAGTEDLAQRELDYRRALRQAPAIIELRYVDATGREQLLVSRLTMNVVGSGVDYSSDPLFVRARAEADQTQFSDVYFRSGSEPYVTLGRGEGGAGGGVTLAALNLKLIGDVIAQIQTGQPGYAYVVDRNGRLIAHPDIDLVLQQTDLSMLPQVFEAVQSRTARSQNEGALSGHNLNGDSVLSAYEVIDPPGWSVFVEEPSAAAFGPLYASLERTAFLLIAGLALSVLTGLYVTRRMTAPVEALRVGAARIGAGALDHRIQVSTHDELEALADEFNRMGARLQESQASLEKRIQERTGDLMATLEELARRSRQVEIASQHKSEFVAHMSHELRTPLHAIIGFSEMLLDQMYGDLNERQSRYQKHVLDAGRHLLSLINDILDLSRVEAGRMDLDRDQFVLTDVLESSLNVVRERAMRRGIHLDLEVNPAVGIVDGDERKIKQVVLNLLSNAVKFTPDGGTIWVAANVIDGEIQVTVRDTGKGIPRKDWDRIFEPFRQAADGAGAPQEGTGLGLTLSREFVELHGGKLWLESEVGRGSAFMFTLPIAPGAVLEPAT